MPLFTTANAVAYGKAGALARWSPKPQPATPPPITEAIADEDKARALARTKAQLESVDNALDGLAKGKVDPRAWDALTRAKERLFKQWTHLANIPAPAPFKSNPVASRRRELPRMIDGQPT